MNLLKVLHFLKNIYFGCAGSLLLHRLFCSGGEWELLSSCSVGASLIAERGLQARGLQ